MEKTKVFVEICREDIELPQYANLYDAGMDIRAAIDINIKPMETAIIPTGLKFAIPIGYEIQVRPRSGISYKTPLRVSNSPGTIDTGYRDEVGILISNTSTEATKANKRDLNCKNNEEGTYYIKKGERIAQIVLNRIPIMEFEVVDDIKKIGSNRGGGFGSSGI